MTFCAEPSGTAIVGGTGVYISGSGTPGDPWVINVTEPVDLADMEGDIANLQTDMLALPATYVNVTGDEMTGLLTINATSAALRLRRSGLDTPFMEFYDATGLTRVAFIQASSGLLLNATDDAVRFAPDGTERARVTTLATFIGKTSSDLAANGVELHTAGSVSVTRTVLNNNITSNKIGAANVDGAIHALFCAGGTTIGSITRATASTIAFNTSSDEDLKDNMLPIDDDLAMLWMRTIEPMFFNYKTTPDVRHVGYSAERVAEQWPNGVANGIIKPGHGDIADRTWDEDGNETTDPAVWQAWMMDHSKITPILHSCLQALDRTIEERGVILADQEARIAALEAALADQGTVIDGVSDDVGLLRNEVYYTRQMTAGWQYSNTATSPPGAGQLRTNTPPTLMWVHRNDTDGYDRKAALDFLVATTAAKSDGVRFRLRGATGSVVELRTNGPAVNNGTFYTVPITVVSGDPSTKGFRLEVTMLSEIWAEDPPPIPTQLPALPGDEGVQPLDEPDSGS